MGPKAYIIAGPNGAGKTTFARKFLPSYAQCRNFINADLIAQGMSPFAPEAAAFRAGRLVLDEIDEQVRRKADFGFETTLSGRGYLNLIHRLRTCGYEIHIYFLWLPALDLALSRIRDRVLKGGHNVPEADVRRRFDRSIKNFMMRYRTMADSWTLFDNAAETPSVIALQANGQVHIMRAESYNYLLERYGRLR
jgi:predicted ABC-type ATPase